MNIKTSLQKLELNHVFVEELGWEPVSGGAPVVVVVEGQSYELQMVAEKKHIVALLWRGEKLIEYSIRLKIERQIARLYAQHVIVFSDGKTQVWQWVRREIGQPLAVREHRLEPNGNVEALWRKLEQLKVSLEEEELLDSLQMDAKVRRALDVESVTKKFYDGFTREHTAFLSFIKGIPDEEDHAWYASVMLNRLMFIYFVQSKGFLDGDKRYLQNKLAAQKGNFYRDFLCPLFFSGFAKKKQERSEVERKLLGNVPYLNGGLFLKHQLEHENTIQIADACWSRLFDFFDKYQWQLDEKPRRQEKEINPDVLGFIFEKYINQKQMGAYYTKEDITGYISRNTILPWLFEAAREDCAVAFDGEQSVWQLLQNDPDRYVYAAVKCGLLEDAGEQSRLRALPPEIEEGVLDVSKRGGWNKPAPEDWALPTEIWREVVARRTRFIEIREKLSRGEVRSINDLVTLNLDIEQFAQHVVESAPGPDLLRALWKHLERVSVLDPTCGSGAFLFAALNVLKPLYSACLDRMQSLIDETPTNVRFPEQFNDFKTILARVETHANRDYFVLKSIIVNNLFGVDIMHEATEICRLRLFLKLVAQVEHERDIEPLPDIDFNIRAGNTLVGFANLKEVERVGTRKLAFDDDLARIKHAANRIGDKAREFRGEQLEHGSASPKLKAELEGQLLMLGNELNGFLAEEYSVGLSRKTIEYSKWLKSHEPFHWFVAFYDIIETRGGFDVIIGNPPYVEYSKVKNDYTIKGYETESCGNLYAFVMERSKKVLIVKGRFGMIVPVSSLSSERANSIQQILLQDFIAWNSTFSNRPAKLFDGVEQRLAVIVAKKASNDSRFYSASYQHWYSRNREYVFPTLSFAEQRAEKSHLSIGKIGSETHGEIVKKMHAKKLRIQNLLSVSSQKHSWFHDGPTYWIRSMTFEPNSETSGRSSHYKALAAKDELSQKILTCLLNSSTFYLFFKTFSNCRDFSVREILPFPIGEFSNEDVKLLRQLETRLSKSYVENKEVKSRIYPSGEVFYDEFYPSKSKPIIDEIDRVLASHYGFTDEELDFIVNYDIKYRMGRESEV